MPYSSSDASAKEMVGDSTLRLWKKWKLLSTWHVVVPSLASGAEPKGSGRRKCDILKFEKEEIVFCIAQCFISS